MRAYYNECEPFAAQWLRNLVSAGLIAPGDVDERDIRDVHPSDLKGYTQCHFFAGVKGKARVLQACNSSDPAIGGTSGKEPKSSRATQASCWCGARPISHAPAYEPPRLLALHRRPRRLLGHPGLGCRTADSCCRAGVSPWSEPCKLPPSLGGAYRTHALTWQRWPCGNRRNKATCWLALAQEGTRSRICGNCALQRASHPGASCGNGPYSGQSSTSCASGLLPSCTHTPHTPTRTHPSCITSTYYYG